MSKNPFNKQTLMQGALTLTVAWIIVRILGGVYRIPLGRMLGNEGLAIYAPPNQFYMLFFTISAAGIPVALASIISEKITLGRYYDAFRTFRLARFAMLVLGLTFSLLLFVSAEWLSKFQELPESYLGMRMVAPVIFFAAVTAAYRGLFQGLQNMRAVSYSIVIDQILLVISTLLFSYLLLPQGVAIAAAGANLGAVPGAVGATLLLVFLYRTQRQDIMEMVRQDLSGVREGALSLLKRIFILSLPISFASVAMTVTHIIDTKFIMARLQFGGYTHDQAEAMYGDFTGMAMAFINICTALAVSLGTSLVPAVAQAFIVNDIKRIKYQVAQAIRLSVIFALPAAAGLYILADQLILLIFANETAGVPLVTLSAAVVFWSLHLVTTGALQGMGQTYIPARNLVIGIMIKLPITYYLTPTALGIKAAALGTVLLFAVSSLLNIMALWRFMGLKLNLTPIFLRSGLATLVMSAGVLYVYRVSVLEIGGNTWPTLLAVMAGAVIYQIVLVMVGGIRANDVRRIPGVGERAAVILEKLGRG